MFNKHIDNFVRYDEYVQCEEGKFLLIMMSMCRVRRASKKTQVWRMLEVAGAKSDTCQFLMVLWETFS